MDKLSSDKNDRGSSKLKKKQYIFLQRLNTYRDTYEGINKVQKHTANDDEIAKCIGHHDEKQDKKISGFY